MQANEGTQVREERPQQLQGSVVCQGSGATPESKSKLDCSGPIAVFPENAIRQPTAPVLSCSFTQHYRIKICT